MERGILALILKAPLVLLGSFSFIASLYASIAKIQGVTFASPIILGIIMGAYFYSIYLERAN
jgi:hypothetical protein